MCILSYLAPGIDSDDEGLLNGGISNPDGHGWAITAGDHIDVFKSLDIVEAVETFAKARKLNPEGHALFHSRWATHGSITTANVHPFHVGKQGGMTVVGHNGILPSNAHPTKGDDRSDTRLFADDILSTRYRRLDKERAIQALADWCGTGNKLVILTVNPRYQRNAYLINKTKGNTDTATGIWHSNYDYLDTPKYVARTWGTGTGKWTSKYFPNPTVIGKSAKQSAEVFQGGGYEEAYEECYMCEYGNAAGGYCDECESCQLCYEWKNDCKCGLTDDEVMDVHRATDEQWLAGLANEQADAFHDYS